MHLVYRFFRLFRGFFALFVGGLEDHNPEALLEAAKQDYRKRVVQYHQALARIAGIAERLKLQIESKTDKTQILEQRILANLKARNPELAGSLARELKELKSDLAADIHELQETESAYQANLTSIKVVQKEFAEKVQRLERQLNRTKIKEAQAEAVSALSGVAFSVGDVGDTLKNVEEVLQKKFEMSAGKMRLIEDLAEGDQSHAREAERRVLEQQALAEFMNGQGLAGDREPKVIEARADRLAITDQPLKAESSS